jgi:hypothetical protein
MDELMDELGLTSVKEQLSFHMLTLTKEMTDIYSSISTIHVTLSRKIKGAPRERSSLRAESP